MKFKVKIDWWVKIIFYGISLAILIPLFYINELQGEERFVILFSVILTEVVILPIPLFAAYVFKENHILLRLGYMFIRIKYDDIVEVNETKRIPTNNSFALSIDALEIIKDSGMINRVVVSPQNKESFIYELKSRSKNLKGKTQLDDEYKW